jgi:hypothetical protein
MQAGGMWCKTSPSLLELDLTRSKPLKRKGLSKFFHKSRSFSSFEDVMSSHHGESAAALAKSPLLLYTAWSDSLLPHRPEASVASGQGSPAPLPSSSLPGAADELCSVLQGARLSPSVAAAAAAAAAVAQGAQLQQQHTAPSGFATFVQPMKQLGRHSTL